MLYRAPLLRLVVPLALGIVLQRNLTLPIAPLAICSIIALAIMVCYQLFISARETYRWRFVFGAVSSILLMPVGYMISESQSPILSRDHFTHSMPEITAMVIRLSEDPIPKKKTLQAESEVVAISDSTNAKSGCGKIVVSFMPCRQVHDLHAGSLVVVTKSPEEIRPPLNPGEFDYRSYLKSKDILARLFLDSTQWRIAGTSEMGSGQLFVGLRNNVLDLLRRNCPDPEAFAVMSALIVGETDFMDGEMMKDYSGAGVIHVLAVSGMHVGLIYAAILFLFRIVLGRRFKWIQFTLIIVALWTFAGISGFSASVLRATVMFSVITLGLTIRRRSDAINNLAGSALLLLVYDADYLYNVGFQLSFAAVAGIVLIGPAIENLIGFKTRWKRSIWQMVCVTTSAQLSTLPFIAFYFHQFPTYFLVANLLIVPFSTIIIYSGIILILLSFSESLAMICGRFCEWMVLRINDLVSFFSRLPGSKVDIGYPDIFEVSILCLLCLCLYLMLIQQWRIGIRVSLLSLSTIFIYMGMSSMNENKTSGLTFFAAGKGQLMVARNGNEAVSVSDTIASSQDRLNNALETWLGSRGNEKHSKYLQNDNISGYDIVVQDKIAVAQGKIILLDTAVSGLARADFILIPGHQAPYVRGLTSIMHKAEIIILPSSVSRRWWNKLQEACPEQDRHRLRWLGEGALHFESNAVRH